MVKLDGITVTSDEKQMLSTVRIWFSILFVNTV